MTPMMSVSIWYLQYLLKKQYEIQEKKAYKQPKSQKTYLLP